jgi:hypothetical protein
MIPFMFATPSGFRALTYIANHFRMPYLRPLQEYRHAQWPLDGPVLLSGSRIAAGGLLPLVMRRLPSLLPTRVLLPCAALGILGGLRIRFVAEFAMLSGPALAVACTRLAPWLGERWPARISAGLLVALTAAPRVASSRRAGGRSTSVWKPDLVPLAAVDFRREERAARTHVQRSRGRLVPDLAGVAALPRVPGSAHQRLPRCVSRRASPLDLSRAEWQSFLDGFGVTSALVTFPSVNPRGALFDPSLWALVYRANDGLVFVRRSFAGRPARNSTDLFLFAGKRPCARAAGRAAVRRPCVQLRMAASGGRLLSVHWGCAQGGRHYDSALAAEDSRPAAARCACRRGFLPCNSAMRPRRHELLEGATTPWPEPTTATPCWRSGMLIASPGGLRQRTRRRTPQRRGDLRPRHVLGRARAAAARRRRRSRHCLRARPITCRPAWPDSNSNACAAGPEKGDRARSSRAPTPCCWVC